MISTQVEAAAQAAAEPGVQVASLDGDVVAFATELADEMWLESLEPAAGPKSAAHLVIAELTDRFGSRHVLGNKADKFVKWLGPANALLVLQLIRAFSCDDCDYLLSGLLPAGERQYGRRSKHLLLAIHEAYCAARPRDEAPLGVAAFIEHVAAPVVAKLCAERPCILEQRPDAPYSYVFAAVCALLTLLAQPRRRFEGEMADVGCVKSRVSSAEYASFLAFFPDVLALPSTLEELFMTTLRPTITEDSSEWSTSTITYKGDDGIVQVLDPDTPPTPVFALDFVRECGAAIEAISKQGRAPLDAIRCASAAFADVCLIFDVRSSATASALRLEIVDNYGSPAWWAVRYFTDCSDASLQHAKQRLAELGFDEWIKAQMSSLREAASADVDAAVKLATCRFGHDRGPLKRLAEGGDEEARTELKALQRADRIEQRKKGARRCVVLAARAARDPGDKYVQMANVDGLRAALAALVSEGGGEEAREARAALEALQGAQRIVNARRSAVLARRADRNPDDGYVRMAHADGLRAGLAALAETDEEDARAALAELEALRHRDREYAARWDREYAARLAVALNAEEEAIEFWGAQPSLQQQTSPASYLWYNHGVMAAGVDPRDGPEAAQAFYDLLLADLELRQHVAKAKRMRVGTGAGPIPSPYAAGEICERASEPVFVRPDWAPYDFTAIDAMVLVRYRNRALVAAFNEKFAPQKAPYRTPRGYDDKEQYLRACLEAGRVL